MTRIVSFGKAAGRLMIMAVVFGQLSACAAEIEEEIGACDPGVGEISHATDVTPPGC